MVLSITVRSSSRCTSWPNDRTMTMPAKAGITVSTSCAKPKAAASGSPIACQARKAKEITASASVETKTDPSGRKVTQASSVAPTPMPMVR